VIERRPLEHGVFTDRAAAERYNKEVERWMRNVSKSFVSMAKSDTSLKVSFEKGDAEDIPLEDGAFDLVVSSNTLHLIENPVSMFDEVHRVLKPEGRFIISDHRRSWLGIFSAHIRASYTPDEVKELLRRSNLQDWAVNDYFFWLSIVSRF
jgi:ubiquinone/menaquinone biosynthesis C-methylase UbiE